MCSQGKSKIAVLVASVSLCALAPPASALAADLSTPVAGAASQPATTTSSDTAGRTYTAVSNIMKTKHDTVKNSISNIR